MRRTAALVIVLGVAVGCMSAGTASPPLSGVPEPAATSTRALVSPTTSASPSPSARPSTSATATPSPIATATVSSTSPPATSTIAAAQPTPTPIPPATAAPAPEPLRARVTRLQRGVNITLWFRYPASESDAYFASYIDDTDLAFISGQGFTHVRLCIAPQYIYDPLAASTLNVRMLPFVERAIAKIQRYGLAVVVDLHDESRTFESAAAGDQLVTFWSSFAARLSTFDPDRTFIELLNEPVFERNGAAWLALQRRLIAAVRAAAPRHTIVATGALWGGAEGLLQVTPSDDANVVYSFHFYDPHTFTHQSADWGDPAWIPIAGLSYPYDPANCARVLGSLSAADSRTAVSDYCDRQWDRGTLTRLVGSVVAWRQRYGNVPLFVGEIGVYCKASPKAAKLAWLRDARSIFESNGIGWALWGYDDCFGLDARKENGVLVYDRGVMDVFAR